MNYWALLPVGYAWTVLIEIPILLLGLSPIHSWKQKLFAGFWLTGCTYPIVMVVLPQYFSMDTLRGYLYFLAVAETFAPLAECLLFYFLFLQPEKGETPPSRSTLVRDMTAIVVANLASFGLGWLAGDWIFGWMVGDWNFT